MDRTHITISAVLSARDSTSTILRDLCKHVTTETFLCSDICALGFRWESDRRHGVGMGGYEFTLSFVPSGE